MSSTLSEGVRVPDIGSVNWGADVNFNWGLLNTALANISDNVKVDAENTWTAPQTFTETISGSIDGVAARAVGDEDGNNIKAAIAGKQPSLSQTQLDACNSGVTAAAVQQIGTNASNISGLQTAVSSKAADSAVVHLAGAETITGDKTWTGTNRFGLSLYQKGFSPRASSPTTNEFGRFGIIDTDNISVMSINYANRTTGVRDLTFRVYDSTGNVNGAGVFKDASNNYSFCSLDPNNAISLGNSDNQWSSVYAQSYYYKGTQWGLDKANTWTAEQTITNNFFVIKETGYELGQSYPSGSHVNGLILRDKNGSTVGLIDIVDRSYGNMEMRIKVQQKYDPNSNNRSTSGNILFNELIVGITPDKQNYIRFNADLWGNNHNLGTSTNKWKTLNGINPGALCLQNFNAGITLDTTNWDMTGKYGADANFWTPTVNGWLTVLVNGTPGSGWVQLSQADSLGQFSVCLSTGYAWATIPVIANWQCKICLLCSTVSAKFYPCLGNV